ncbi:hypothetical protein MSG28_011741 [Choristoneura fumiferana]|uniref:Uncharacterized protein n=1 Tax=Choristoneura fumiferana TaxID=7141 RepID=A0ACC0KLV3_CHOFU|nr:hypothetical protein MSG28_011741 [Choristoneura fumiferana]
MPDALQYRSSEVHPGSRRFTSGSKDYVRFVTVGGDDYYLNGGFNPGKRCVNMWDDGCTNGQLGGSGGDDYYLNGGFNPGRL